MKSIFFVLVILNCFVGCHDKKKYVSEFDAVKWQQDENGYNGVRNSMIKDVTERIVQIGMTESEILSLLGEPEQKKDSRFVYGLGVFLGASPYYLEIEFDSNKQVSSKMIRQG